MPGEQEKDTGIVLPGPRTTPRQLEARRGEEGSSPTSFRGNKALLTPGPYTSSLQNLEQGTQAATEATQFVALCYGSLSKLRQQRRHHNVGLINIPNREPASLWGTMW